MNKIYLIAMLAAVSACSSNEPITMSFSPVFKLVSNSKDLTGSTIFYSDELSYKTQDGSLYSAVVLNSEYEKLPEGFDMREYPKILLGMLEIDQQSKAKTMLDKTYGLFKSIYNLDQAVVEEENNVIYYSACGGSGCQAYVVKKDFSEQVFSMRSNVSEHNKFRNYLKEKVHVE